MYEKFTIEKLLPFPVSSVDPFIKSQLLRTESIDFFIYRRIKRKLASEKIEAKKIVLDLLRFYNTVFHLEIGKTIPQ